MFFLIIKENLWPKKTMKMSPDVHVMCSTNDPYKSRNWLFHHETTQPTPIDDCHSLISFFKCNDGEAEKKLNSYASTNIKENISVEATEIIMRQREEKKWVSENVQWHKKWCVEETSNKNRLCSWRPRVQLTISIINTSKSEMRRNNNNNEPNNDTKIWHKN